MSARLRPPMPYAGGKQKVAGRIADLLPTNHLHYVEPYCGSMSVLFAKRPSVIETVNDIDGDVVNFFEVLRDKSDELGRRMALTPHARAEFDLARDPGACDDEDPVVRAWRFWVRLTQSRGSRPSGKAGWRFVQGGTTRHSLAKYLDGYLARVAPCAERLREVSVECRPALDVIREYDRPTTLFYVDPPYLGGTRSGVMYRSEMTGEDGHRELLGLLAGIQGKAVVSGYRTPLYDGLLTGWERVDLPTTCMTGASRVESVWLNYEPPAAQDELPEAA